MRTRRIVIRSLSGLQYFSTLSHKRYDFREKLIEHKMCILIFYTTFVWNISHSKENWASLLSKTSSSGLTSPFTLNLDTIDNWQISIAPDHYNWRTSLRYRTVVESIWNMMAHGVARERKWRWNWRMEWVASTLHTISEHDVSSITTADAHTSAASSRPNLRPCRFKWTRPFRRKTKSGFCACAITFQTQSNTVRAQGPIRMFCRSKKVRFSCRDSKKYPWSHAALSLDTIHRQEGRIVFTKATATPRFLLPA